MSNPAVYAAGDCADSGPPLTPVAGREGKVVAANLLQGHHVRLDYTGVPSVVFTVPPLARVGLSEAQARERGLSFDGVQGDTASWYASRRIHEKHAGFKVLVERGTGRILGAHLLGTLADELINLFALAIQFGLRASDLKEAFYAYPTHASNVPYMV
ncbi:Dihydrolipoyl dehydrogenase [bacterium HR11]|nr:Dihydrolipoyl dehydrogenase [bacterium HR11]